ncbi:MAG: 2,3-bisphosphoglycerate-independent phosphoglycerate mutase [Methanosarcinales archaeon]|nr:2,3-bisphosphoglycerate-independent phosphoglycerate mutase [Methanosarcinales archaeon]
MAIPKPLVLLILDGWGINQQVDGNAVLMANTPVIDRLLSNYPNTTLEASGESVGLPDGLMGNSEVGHLNLGSGRVVYQDITRINKSIKDGDLFSNEKLSSALAHVLKNGSSLHMMGLLSDGGVHSHIDHLFSLLEMANKAGLDRVFVHAFLDGRDVPPRSALQYITQTEKRMQELGVGKIATVSGRYYSMDRDKRWERVCLAYDALTMGEGETAPSAEKAVMSAYERGENDEFVKPTVVLSGKRATATIHDGDAVIFFNFRSDRARELTGALTLNDFTGFHRKQAPDIHFVCMTRYDETFDVPIAFPHEHIDNTLSEYLSNCNKRQLHIAETEKYAHVTFFFNGGLEEPYKGEDRLLIPSPKIPTYDLQPEMSAYEVTNALLDRIEFGNYDVIIANFANLDMVGHTGMLDATMNAAKVVDECLGKMLDVILSHGGAALVTSDHGNSEQMVYYDDESPHTAHTTNRVPLIFFSEIEDIEIHEGILADIAPTMLKLLGLDIPPQMTGHSLFCRKVRDKL